MKRLHPSACFGFACPLDRLLPLVFALFCGAAVCRAVPHQWDADTNTIGVQDGPGDWQANHAELSFWTTDGGASNTTWPDTNVVAEAVFGGGGAGMAGTISMVNSLAGSPMVDAITFNTPFAGDYALAGSGGHLQLADGTTITVNGGNPAINVSMGPANGSTNAGLTKLGSGTLWLGGANTFSNLTISGGTVVVGSDSSLGAAAVGSLRTNQFILDGGTLKVTNSFGWGNYRGIYLTANGGTIDVAAGVTLTKGGGTTTPASISGPAGGNFIKAGDGTLSVTIVNTNPSTYLGGTIVAGGTLLLAGNDRTTLVGAGGLTINAGAVVSVATGKNGLISSGASVTNMGGTFVAGGYETNSFLVLGGNGLLTNGSTASRMFYVTNTIILQSGTVIGNGSPIPTNRFYLAGPATLRKTTPGTVYIVGTNSAQVQNYLFTGKTIISAGVLNLGLDDAFGLVPSSFTADQLTMDGGTLQIARGYNWGANRGVTITANGGTFDIGSGLSQTVPVVIAGTSGGGLTKVGGGTLSLTGANTYDGPTLVNAGRLYVNNTDSSGTGFGAVTVAGNATLGGTGTVGGSVTLVPGAQAYLFKTSGSADTPLTVNGVLSLHANTVQVDLGGATLDAGTYRLLNYLAGKGGSFNATPTIVNGTVTLPAGIDETVAGQINLVVGNSVPFRFGSISQSGTELILSGGGGKSKGTYYVLSSTNVAAPLSSWTPVATNLFDGSGGFIFTNAINPARVREFFILKTQ